jgi:hypothetical protein
LLFFFSDALPLFRLFRFLLLRLLLGLVFFLVGELVVTTLGVGGAVGAIDGVLEGELDGRDEGALLGDADGCNDGAVLSVGDKVVGWSVGARLKVGEVVGEIAATRSPPPQAQQASPAVRLLIS